MDARFNNILGKPGAGGKYGALFVVGEILRRLEALSPQLSVSANPFKLPAKPRHIARENNGFARDFELVPAALPGC
jgi:hypothetical protein